MEIVHKTEAEVFNIGDVIEIAGNDLRYFVRSGKDVLAVDLRTNTVAGKFNNIEVAREFYQKGTTSMRMTKVLRTEIVIKGAK